MRTEFQYVLKDNAKKNPKATLFNGSVALNFWDIDLVSEVAHELFGKQN